MAERLPTEPGRYYWDEWNKEVEIFRIGNSLYVRPWKGWHKVKISPRIAGKFTKVADSAKEPA